MSARTALPTFLIGEKIIRNIQLCILAVYERLESKGMIVRDLDF